MSDRYRFHCPSCGARVVVDADVRASVRASGCPLCGARSGEFEPLDCAEQSR